MCGRFGLEADPEQLAHRFGATQSEIPWAPRYNIAPSQEVPVVTPEKELALVRWGYSPQWMREQSPSRQIINAKAETLFTSRTFRDAAVHDRVIVPCSYYFEWDRTKRPYLFRLRQAEIFGLAGVRLEQDGESRVVIVTTEPNRVAARVHARMPAVLRPEDEELWLSADETDPHRLGRLLLPVPDDWLEYYPVSRRVNNPSNDSPDILQPAHQE